MKGGFYCEEVVSLFYGDLSFVYRLLSACICGFCEYNFLLTVDKHRVPTEITVDKIALSWGGGLALMSDSCSIQEYQGGPYTNVRNQRSDSTVNAGVGYQVYTKYGDKSVLLRATVNTANSGAQMKNVAGTYARWTGGLNIFSFSFGAGSIGINTPWGTTYDQMPPVYNKFF